MVLRVTVKESWLRVRTLKQLMYWLMAKLLRETGTVNLLSTLKITSLLSSKTRQITVLRRPKVHGLKTGEMTPDTLA